MEIPGGYEIMDISGKTVMPGLIDVHLHFSGNLTDNDTDWVMEDVIQKAVVAVQQAHECLESGLTTVRGDIQVRYTHPQHDRQGHHERAPHSCNGTRLLRNCGTRRLSSCISGNEHGLSSLGRMPPTDHGS